MANIALGAAFRAAVPVIKQAAASPLGQQVIGAAVDTGVAMLGSAIQKFIPGQVAQSMQNTGGAH